MNLRLWLRASSLLLLPACLAEVRPRPRSIGIYPGELPPGPNNCITDVESVRVGHVTLNIGDNVRTGATAIIPHLGDMYRNPVPAGHHKGNGCGNMIGTTQIDEFGELETPILLTNTLSVQMATQAIIDYTGTYSGNPSFLNPVVGETYDGYLNDEWLFALTSNHHLQALEIARNSPAFSPVEEGSVGAGRGTQIFAYKGGIGSSSRIVEINSNRYTVGVLVQTNYGGNMDIVGVPVGRLLKEKKEQLSTKYDGSCMIIVATDAPVSDRNLKRMAHRGVLALGRTGSWMSNGSGDYVVAFSTSESVRRDRYSQDPISILDMPNDRMSVLFQAVEEATEESIYNAMWKATTVEGNGGILHELLIDEVYEILKNRGAIRTV